MEPKHVFLEKFQSIFDETDPKLITLTTKFKELEEWSSLMILSLIVLCEEEYNIKLSPGDIEKSIQVEDLFKLISK